MIDPQKITSMTEFKRDTGRWMRRIRKTGKPGLPTVNGRAEAVVMDTASFQKWVEAVERAEVIAAVEKSMKEFADGMGVPAAEALRKIKARKSA